VNANGFETIFGVLGVVSGADCSPAWYRVQLPVRPNGAVGYVHARAVKLVEIRTRIEIDLSERRLDFLRDGEIVRRLTTAVGAPGTPTPTGRFYVNQRIIAGNPDGPWGPAALGISAFSPTLVDWTQGGPIAIHGTNNPSSIGRAASNGCIRLPNPDLERLYDETPAGTPVVIRA
jgi:lipoprotein-anchoring transpeptidase ErfK/SrfK